MHLFPFTMSTGTTKVGCPCPSFRSFLSLGLRTAHPQQTGPGARSAGRAAHALGRASIPPGTPRFACSSIGGSGRQSVAWRDSRGVGHGSDGGSNGGNHSGCRARNSGGSTSNSRCSTSSNRCSSRCNSGSALTK